MISTEQAIRNPRSRDRDWVRSRSLSPWAMSSVGGWAWCASRLSQPRSESLGRLTHTWSRAQDTSPRRISGSAGLGVCCPLLVISACLLPLPAPAFRPSLAAWIHVAVAHQEQVGVLNQADPRCIGLLFLERFSR
jgi:hypothetical protein